MEQTDSVITAITIDPRDPDKMRVTVDDRVYVVDAHLLSALGLCEGKYISSADMKKLSGAAAESAAKAKALRLLAGRAYTEYEMRQRLLRANIPEAAVERVIAWLLELKYIDDRAFAKAWVEDRAERKGTGPLLLSHELSQRGVAPELIREAIDAYMNEERMEAIAITQAERRLSRCQNLGRREKCAKIYAFLQRKGFPADVIRRVLNRVID